MTPKEKAKELFDKFSLGYYHAPNAKQCALVTVNEIIESRKDDIAFNDTMWVNASEYYTPHPMYLNYWNLVKKEIENL
jgi:hypothetical protein